MKKNIVIVVLAVIAAILLGLNVFQFHNRSCDYETVKVTDTVTLTKTQLVPHEVTRYITRYDTIVYAGLEDDKKVSPKDIIVSLDKKFFDGWKQNSCISDTLSPNQGICLQNDSNVTTLPYNVSQNTIKQNTMPLFDTLPINISIPIEHKTLTYSQDKDSIRTDLYVEYSGYRASIDSLSIISTYQPTLPIKKERRYGLMLSAGIYAGYGISFLPSQQYSLSPEIGIGLCIGFGYRLTK